MTPARTRFLDFPSPETLVSHADSLRVDRFRDGREGSYGFEEVRATVPPVKLGPAARG